MSQRHRLSTDKQAVCPWCARPIAEESGYIWNPVERTLAGRGLVIQFTPIRARFFDELWKGRCAGSSPTANELLERIYGHELDSRELNTVRAHISYIRGMIGPFDLDIEGSTWGYRLTGRTGAAAAAAAATEVIGG